MGLTGISGQIVLITGASGSIGSGTATEFAGLGAKLALTGRDQDKLEATSLRCQKAGAAADQILLITGDITREDDIQNIVDTTVEKFGGIDILVNGAGLIKAGDFLETKTEEYDIIFNTNTKGTFLMCQKAIPHIIKKKGNIINISSFTGIKPSFSYFAYSMAEAALDQFTKALALQLGPKGVRVNSVNPGVVRDTGLWTRDGAPFVGRDDTVKELQDGLPPKYPMRRLAEVRDVAKAVTFLSSREAGFVHGVVLPVDGGKILTSKPAAIPPKPKA